MLSYREEVGLAHKLLEHGFLKIISLIMTYKESSLRRSNGAVEELNNRGYSRRRISQLKKTDVRCV